MDFDIEHDSKCLKDLVSIYASVPFLEKIADVIGLIEAPRIPFRPFVALDSPLIQLLYIASLNISSSAEKVRKHYIEDVDWDKIIEYTVRIKAGYFDLLIPEENEDEIAFLEKYKVVLPVFLEFYNSGVLNFEEQEINKVLDIFSSFDNEIKKHYGLSVQEFIDIYNLIDLSLINHTNLPTYLAHVDDEVKDFWKKMRDTQVHPDDWKYTGGNKNIINFINHFQDPNKRFEFVVSSLEHLYDIEKITTFLKVFSLKRSEIEPYRFYTSPNLLINYPIFDSDDNFFVIPYVKQLIHAIYKELTSFGKSLGDRFYRQRGKFLQEKIIQVLSNYFGETTLIFNEYHTSLTSEDQDVLLLSEGLAIIIEAKAGREPDPRRDGNVKDSFKAIVQYFVRNIQSGYDQASRIINLLNQKKDFEVLDKKGQVIHKVHSGDYQSAFSFIITLDKFREVQMNLNHLLQLGKDDKYPISMCIDDFEVLMLTLKKIGVNNSKFTSFCKLRQSLQGRVAETCDELSIWADFILNEKFSIPSDPHYHFVPSVVGADLFDDLYKKGLGFKNEKYLVNGNKRYIEIAENAYQRFY